MYGIGETVTKRGIVKDPSLDWQHPNTVEAWSNGCSIPVVVGGISWSVWRNGGPDTAGHASERFIADAESRVSSKRVAESRASRQHLERPGKSAFRSLGDNGRKKTPEVLGNEARRRYPTPILSGCI